MKRTWKTAMIVGTAAVALTLSGCGLGNMVKDWESSASETNMKYDVRHEQRVSNQDIVRLVLDVDVSSVEIRAVEGNQIEFVQKATHEELLAEMTTDQKSDGIEVKFKTPSQLRFDVGNKNAKAIISLPKGTQYIIDAKVAVGSIKIEANELTLKQGDFSLDVGDLELKADGAQPLLESLDCQVDVGNVAVQLGAVPKLNRIKGITNVGNLEISFAEVVAQDFELKGQVDVGDLKMDMHKSQQARLTCDIPEFVGDLEIKGLEYYEKNDAYYFGEQGSNYVFDGELSVGTGNVSIIGK